jgi:hypothetical protein
MFKLLMTWDIRRGLEDEYFEFVMEEFGPAMMELGIRPTDAWYTAYGSGPQVLAGGIADDLDSLRWALSSEEWHEMKDELLNYVRDYDQKIVHATGKFQL